MAENTLSPVEALRAIRRVMADKKSLTPAQRLAIIGVIVRADNKSGKAWASYSGLRNEAGLGLGTIRSAMEKARGVHLAVEPRRGRHGSLQYRILKGGNGQASTTETVSLPDSSDTDSDRPALPSGAPSTTNTVMTLAPLSRPNESDPRESAHNASVQWTGERFRFPETFFSEYVPRTWPDIDRRRIEREIERCGRYYVEKGKGVKEPESTLVRWLGKAFDKDQDEAAGLRRTGKAQALADAALRRDAGLELSDGTKPF